MTNTTTESHIIQTNERLACIQQVKTTTTNLIIFFFFFSYFDACLIYFFPFFLILFVFFLISNSPTFNNLKGLVLNLSIGAATIEPFNHVTNEV